MSDSRTFSGITADVLGRIKQAGSAEYGIAFDPADGPAGTASGRTPLGECIVEFAHDNANAALLLTLVKKPMLLPAGVLWRGLTETIERCRGDSGE